MLSQSDRAWIKRTAAAMRAILWGSLAYCLWNVAGAAIMSRRTLTRQDIIWWASACYILEAAIVFFLAAAHWRLSAGSSGSGPEARSSKLYRSGIALVVFSKTALLAFMFFFRGSFAGTIANWIGNFGFIVGTTGFLQHLRILANRVPNDSLVRTSGWLMWSFPPVLLMHAGLALWVQIYRPILSMDNLWFRWTYIPLALSLAVSMALSLLLLWRLRRRFLQAALSASATPGLRLAVQ